MRAVIRRKLDKLSIFAPAPPPVVQLDERKLNADEVANALGLSPSTVLKQFGHTPGVIRIGRGRRQLIRWPESVVRRILEVHTIR
jgi:predicted DNA-binding transcriptional regulator AlpA